MTSAGMPRDIDRILEAWFEDGPTLAADRVVGAALTQVEQTSQAQPLRRRVVLGLDDRGRTRLALMAAAVALLALTFGLAVQLGIIDLTDPTPTPSPSASASTSATVAPSFPAVTLDDGPPTEDGYAFVFPSGWTQADETTWQWSGTDPQGRFSVMVGTGGDLNFCPDECTQLLFDMPVPFSAERAVDVLAGEIAEVTGNTDWEPLPADAIPGLEAGRRQQNTVLDPDWGESRQVIVIGDFLSRVVAFTLTQPADSFDERLLAQLMSGVFLDPAGPTYAQGALVPYTDDLAGWTIEVQDNWTPAFQPTLADGSPAHGVRRFNGDYLQVSVGDANGDLRVCDATCFEVSGQTSMDDLRSMVATWMPPSAQGTAEESGQVLLSGIVGEYLHREVQGAEGLRTRYAAYGLTDGRPFLLAFDVPSEIVTYDAVQQFSGSFHFLEPPAPGDTTFAAPDGSFAVDLNGDRWIEADGPDSQALYLDRDRVTVLIRSGDATGRIKACDEPVPGGFERCRIVRATSVEELADETALPTIEDYFSVPTFDTISLAGEPAVLMQLQTFVAEPIYKPVWLTYVVTIHDGRPLIARFAFVGRQSSTRAVREVLAGFRWTD
jgi:hypothetical protein